MSGNQFTKPRPIEKEIEDGRKIAELFTTLSEESKNMVMIYTSALRDKEVADGRKEPVEV